MEKVVRLAGKSKKKMPQKKCVSSEQKTERFNSTNRNHPLSKYTVIALLPLLASCSSNEESGELADTIHSQSEFSLGDAFDDPVKEGYVFCEYADAESGEELGFDPDDFYGVYNNPHDWEVKTGIGVIFQDDAREPVVEWFAPEQINTCVNVAPYRHLEPGQKITVGTTVKDFTNRGEAEIKTLSIQK
ncbi:hypothetical protein V5S96_05920 [Corynebacterium mastitidis]|uniref:DUF3558 domain-containing protein n=1 Tax=Corynebacterium mastitidis TaxID=161890 RepID=A0ABU8NYL5_9CORY